MIDKTFRSSLIDNPYEDGLVAKKMERFICYEREKPHLFFLLTKSRKTKTKHLGVPILFGLTVYCAK
jgi:hypothetical protein